MSQKDAKQNLKVLFLYNRERTTAYNAILRGEGHSAGFWGMIHLPRFRIDAHFVEFEQYVSPRVAQFLRRYIFANVYFVHALFLPKLMKCDVVFTSSAFGTQLLHALWPFRTSRWIMHDFSITSMIGSKTTLKQRVFSWLVERADGIVTVGKEEAEKLKVMFPLLAKKIEYIPFGVDLSFFQPMHTKETNVVLAVGFDPDRDWTTLVEAVRGTDIVLEIATRKDRLKHISLPDNVTHRTYTQRELIEAYDAAAVVVLPMDTRGGLNDAMGCSTLFEAMAMQKAIVATRTHTFESYITDGVNGVLVEERNVKALHDTLETLLKDPQRRRELGLAARRYAEEHLDVILLTSKLAAFFKRIAHRE